MRNILWGGVTIGLPHVRYNEGMTDGFTAFIFGLGVGAWAYGKFMKSTYSTQSGLVGAGFVGIVAFIVLFTILKYIAHY